MKNTLRATLVGILLVAPVCVFGEKPQARSQAPRPQVRRPAAKAPTPSAAPSASDSGEYVTEKRADGTTVKYKKKTTYDFEGVGIDGIHNKPSGSYVSNIKDVKAKSIIRLRQNFDAEVIDSARMK